MIDNRAAWTNYFEGNRMGAPKKHKYGAKRSGKYPSQHQADVAGRLYALQAAGKIEDLREEVTFILIPGRNKVSGISYRADFTWIEENALHVGDAKPWDQKTQKFLKTAEFRLKERMMYLLCGITIELL